MQSTFLDQAAIDGKPVANLSADRFLPTDQSTASTISPSDVDAMNIDDYERHFHELRDVLNELTAWEPVSATAAEEAALVEGYVLNQNKCLVPPRVLALLRHALHAYGGTDGGSAALTWRTPQGNFAGIISNNSGSIATIRWVGVATTEDINLGSLDGRKRLVPQRLHPDVCVLITYLSAKTRKTRVVTTGTAEMDAYMCLRGFWQYSSAEGVRDLQRNMPKSTWILLKKYAPRKRPSTSRSSSRQVKFRWDKAVAVDQPNSPADLPDVDLPDADEQHLPDDETVPRRWRELACKLFANLALKTIAAEVHANAAVCKWRDLASNISPYLLLSFARDSVAHTLALNDKFVLGFLTDAKQRVENINLTREDVQMQASVFESTVQDDLIELAKLYDIHVRQVYSLRLRLAIAISNVARRTLPADYTVFYVVLFCLFCV